jgi:hypothetical protein
MRTAGASFAILLLGALFFGTPAGGLRAVEEYHRETVIIDWEKDQFDMYRYTDSYLRKYEYYFVDYAIKDNPSDSVWKSQIITIAYVNPDYVVIHEVHSYFMINHYFSHDRLVHYTNREDYSPSPYQQPSGDLQYLRHFNTVLAKIRLRLTGETGRYIDDEKRQRDVAYLEGAQKFLY